MKRRGGGIPIRIPSILPAINVIELEEERKGKKRANLELDAKKKEGAILDDCGLSMKNIAWSMIR